MMILLLALLPFAAHAKTLVIIGDSLTAGQGVARDLAYPALLETKIKLDRKPWTVINAGINGSMSASAPARTQAALREKPDLIALALGANDGLRGVPLTTVEDNLARALELCRQAKVKILLLGLKVPRGFDPRFGAEVEAMYARLAKRFQATLLPSMLEGVVGVPAMNQADGMHPNAAGHALIAEHVYRALKPYFN